MARVRTPTAGGNRRGAGIIGGYTPLLAADRARPNQTPMEQAVRVALRPAQGQDWLADPHLLALIRFQTEAGTAARDPREVTVPLAQLSGAPMVETWTTTTPVIERGEQGPLRFAATEHTLFGHLRLDDPGTGSAERVAELAYQQILAFIAQRPQRHLLRMWNYLPAINQGEGDAERYRQFCVGRYRAFEQAQGEPSQFPAATAIGSHVNGQFISFLAGVTPGEPVENPRQVSAFKYPRQYGPRSPSFSRATLKRWACGGYSLLVSGTASVVGHETHHQDLVAQLQETARNLDALQAEAGLPLRPDVLRVYVRNRADLPAVQRAVAAIPSLQVPMVFLEGDICRSNLILEVEAVYEAA